MRLLSLFILFITPTFAYAYLDPGTGSMLLFFLMSVSAMVLYTIKDYFYRVVYFFKGSKKNHALAKIPKEVDILFFSEGKQYWNVFLPIIEALNSKNIKCMYYTLGSDDPALQANIPNLTALFIGSGMGAYMMINKLEVAVVVMTTPQLDIMYLKRSKNVKKYVHVIHSPSDVLMYKKFAFDYFDIIMCSGEHQIESIRMLEKARELPPKELLRTGLTYYDVMNKEKKDVSKENKRPIVLVAPTWGELSTLFNAFTIDSFKLLLEAPFDVVFRPHPQMYVSQKKVINDIEKELLQYDNFRIDKNATAIDSMNKANILISDISGIIFDFYFVYEKPSIVIRDPIRRGGFEANDVTKEVWEIEMLDIMSTCIEKKDIHNIVDIVKRTLQSERKKDIENIREKSLFHFLHAGEVASNQLIHILDDIKGE